MDLQTDREREQVRTDYGIMCRDRSSRHVKVFDKPFAELTKPVGSRSDVMLNNEQ